MLAMVAKAIVTGIEMRRASVEVSVDFDYRHTGAMKLDVRS